MKLTMQILELLLTYIVVSECRVESRDPGNHLSLVHLLRSKRFDFTMFSCTDCRPVMECHTDSYCRYKKGDRYSCQFRCCSFRCVIAGSSGHRANNIFQDDEPRDETGNVSVDKQQYQEFTTTDELNIDDNMNVTATALPSVSLDIKAESTTRILTDDTVNNKSRDEDG